MLQGELSATVPPVREMALFKTTRVPVPQTVEPALLGVVNPDGSVSMNATPFSETVFGDGSVIVIVSVVVPFNAMLVAPNIFPIEGGATTFTVAMLLPIPIPPSTELMGPVLFT